jgi:predicted nucleic acid-binding Zn finger protein
LNLENEKEFLFMMLKNARKKLFCCLGNDADGLVTGHSSYSSVVKPMLQLVDKAAGADYCYH